MAQTCHLGLSIEPNIDKLTKAFEHLKSHADRLYEVKQSLQTFNVIFGNLVQTIQKGTASVNFSKVHGHVCVQEHECVVSCVCM
jgi:hypothetical protein